MSERATAEICDITLGSGSHGDRKQGCCVNEAAAWVAGEPHTDSPKCVPPTIRAITMRLNDAEWPSDADRTRLMLPLAVAHDAHGNCLLDADGFALPGPMLTAVNTPEAERIRRFMAADWAVRVCAPRIMDRRGFAEQAARLRAVAKIDSFDTASEARVVAREVRDSVWTVWRAAAAAAAAAAYAADDAAAAYAADAADAAAAASRAEARSAARLEVYAACIKELILPMCEVA